jgi:hypothetical protein
MQHVAVANDSAPSSARRPARAYRLRADFFETGPLPPPSGPPLRRRRQRRRRAEGPAARADVPKYVRRAFHRHAAHAYGPASGLGSSSGSDDGSSSVRAAGGG